MLTTTKMLTSGKPIITVQLASRSPIKIHACLKAFRQFFPIVMVEPFSIDSEVAEQPNVMTGAVFGALNRYRGLPQGKADYCVSIESYFSSNGLFEDPYDQAIVIVGKKGGGDPITTKSIQVGFPMKFAKVAKDATPEEYNRQDTGYSMTVGAAMHLEDPDIQSDNWQQCEGGREKQISDAIIEAILLLEIPTVRNFPKPGVTFYDINPLLLNMVMFKGVIKQMAAKMIHPEQEIDLVAGIESRGFILGIALAMELNKPFILVRKPNKLPPPKRSVSIGTEYSNDTLEVSDKGGFEGKTILIVDDILATGGTMYGACHLFTGSGFTGPAKEVICMCLLEVEKFQGRKKLKDVEVISFLTI
jgi:adenine phosphoribosyltransferase